MALRQFFLLILFLSFSARYSYSQAVFENTGNVTWSTSTSANWVLISGTDADGIPDANDTIRVVDNKQLKYNSDTLQAGKIEIEAGSALDIIADPTNLSDSIIVNGQLKISTGSGGIIPTATFNTASELQVETQITSGLNQSFGNVTWNNPEGFSSPTGDLEGNLNDVRGNLTIENTGGDTLYLYQAGTGTIEIGGNLSVQGEGLLSLTESGNVTANVNGNLVVQNDNLTLVTGSGSGIMNISDSLNQDNTTTLDLASASGGTGTLNLNGTGTVQNGTITASVGTGNLTFGASGTQTVDNTGSLAGSNLAITVNASATLALNSNNNETLSIGSSSALTVNGTLHTVAEGASDSNIDAVAVATGGSFTLSSEATLNAGNSDGVSSAIVNDGGTLTFDPGASYILSTTNTDFSTGFATPGISTVNNLTVTTNSDDTYLLDVDLTLNGNLTLTNGTLDLNSNTLTLNGTATRSAGGELAADSTANLIIGGSAGTIDLSSTALTLGNFTVESGGSATLGSAIEVFKYATVDGSLTTGGNLTLKSDANNTGSLIQAGTLTGNVTIERFFDGAAANVSGHFFSSPVASADLSTITVEGFNALSYDENGPALNSPATTAGLYKRVSGTMNVGQGYFTGNDNDQTIAFTGVPNNGPQTGKSFDGTAGLTLSSIVTNDIGDGWNLIGNPYPSAIDWSLVATSGLANGGAAYVWDEDAGNYVSGTGLIIPSSQGFFVQANADGATVDFANNDRVTTQGANDQFSVSRLTAGLPEQVLELKVQNLNSANSTSDRTRIIFRERANPDYSENEDAKKFFGLDRAPSLYTRTPKQDVYTNVLPLPQVGEQVIVPLHLKPGSTSNFTLGVLNNIQNYGPSFRIYLEDTRENQLIDLKQQPEYTFSSTTTDSAARFNIVFSTDAITSVRDIEKVKKSFRLFAAGNTIYLRSNQFINNARITVLDVTGKVHFKQNYSGTGNTDIPLSVLKRGVYFVQVNSDQQFMLKKIFIE